MLSPLCFGNSLSQKTVWNGLLYISSGWLWSCILVTGLMIGLFIFEHVLFRKPFCGFSWHRVVIDHRLNIVSVKIFTTIITYFVIVLLLKVVWGYKLWLESTVLDFLYLFFLLDQLVLSFLFKFKLDSSLIEPLSRIWNVFHSGIACFWRGSVSGCLTIIMCLLNEFFLLFSQLLFSFLYFLKFLILTKELISYLVT